MSKIRFLTAAVVALIMLNLGIVAFFLSPKKPNQPDRPRKIIIERLRFNSDQTSEYENLIVGHRAGVSQKEAEIAEVKQQLYAQLKGEDLSKKDSLINQIGKLYQAIEQLHFNHFKDIKSLCKGDQIADFDLFTDELAQLFPKKAQGRRKDDNK